MSKKLTHEEFLQRLKDNGINDIIPLEEYKGISTSINFKCLKHNCVWKTTPYSVLKGRRCPSCGIEKMSKTNRKSHEQFLSEIMEVEKLNVIILGKYEGQRKNILCKCKTCGYEWEVSPYCLLNNKVECPHCKIVKISKTNSLVKVHPELMKFLKNKEDGYKYNHGSHQKIWTKCPDCGYEREIALHKLSTRGYNCIVCGNKISFPNKFIRYLLLENTIKNQIQNLTFEWYPNWSKRCLFDAYFEKDNKKYVVEMQGEQHKTERWGNKKKNIKEKDEYKRIETRKNDIIEIEIECYTATFEYIKNKILSSELVNILNLKNVDWEYIQENIYSNIIKQVCEEYDKEEAGVTELSKKYKLSRTSIYNYLKIGVKRGWCNYGPNKLRRRKVIPQYIYELYDQTDNKILEENTAVKMSENIKNNLKLKGFDKRTVLRMARDNEIKQGYRIIRKENPDRYTN